jgi:hypothetical protein
LAAHATGKGVKKRRNKKRRNIGDISIVALTPIFCRKSSFGKDHPEPTMGSGFFYSTKKSLDNFRAIFVKLARLY